MNRRPQCRGRFVSKLVIAACVLLCACVALVIAADIQSPFEVELLRAQGDPPTLERLLDSSSDEQYGPFEMRRARQSPVFWVRLRTIRDYSADGSPALMVRKGRHLGLTVFTVVEGHANRVPAATHIPVFRGAQDVLFALPGALRAGDVLFVQVSARGRGTEELRFDVTTLDAALASAAEHARMISLAFGALSAMAIAALLTWFVLADRLLLLYASLFFLHGLYIAYFSGHGFDWPVLSGASMLQSHAWNVPAALSGAVACLFVREIAELRRFSPRVFRIFGALAIAFVLVGAGNFVSPLGPFVVAAGNLLFVFAAVFTLVVAFLAWRRKNRAAGWFLVAWVLLEAATIATALSMLTSDLDEVSGLLYYGLPLSMVAAAVLIALGVADRLRDQRNALSDAERRAQTDPLTGVLNRRSLVERLDAACLRARARGLPIALLFIDLDHFKRINDTFGHAAGDACLRAVIGPIQEELRQSDVIGRYGGEEFIVILSSADVAAARPIAERIRARIADIRVEGFGAPIHVTCSIGVATSDMLGVWGEGLIARADEAVYAAKRAGRNQVQVAAPVAA